MRELGGSTSSHWNVRESYSNIARKLGVDEETVRTRLNKARERGFLPAWRAIVNPLLLNCREAYLDVEMQDEDRKDEAILKIKIVNGVHSIVNFRGREIQVLTYYEDTDSLEKKVQQIEAICGSPRLALWLSTFPRPQIEMKKLDWRILDMMREDAWRDLDDVAKRLGLSTRTVQRRLNAMKEEKAIYIHRPPNVDAVTGLMCSFLVFFSDPDKKRAADKVIHSTFKRIGAFDTSHEQFSMFRISCQNFAEADKVTKDLEAIDGAKDVRMRIIKEIILVEDWVESQIEKQISIR